MQCFITQKIVDMPKVTKRIDVEDLMNLCCSGSLNQTRYSWSLIWIASAF